MASPTTEVDPGTILQREIDRGELKPVVTGHGDGGAWKVYVADLPLRGVPEECVLVWLGPEDPTSSGTPDDPIGSGDGLSCSHSWAKNAQVNLGGSSGRGIPVLVLAGVGPAEAAAPKVQASGGGLGERLPGGEIGAPIQKLEGVRTIPGVGRRMFLLEVLPRDPATGAEPTITVDGEPLG